MTDDQEVFIYVLWDPRCQEDVDAIRYVGQTRRDPLGRLSSHIADAREEKDNDLKGDWIRELLACDLRPLINLIDTVPSKRANEAERYWVTTCRVKGCVLLNRTAGGRAGGLLSDVTKERLRVMQASAWADPERRQRRLTSEGRERFYVANVSRWLAPVFREAFGQAKREQWADPDYRAKMVDAFRRSHGTDEYRAMRRDISARIWKDPEYRTPEHLGTLARNGKRNWEDPEIKQRMLAARSIANARPDVRAKRTAHTKSNWADPSIRAKMMAGKLAAIQRKKGVVCDPMAPGDLD